MEKDADKRCILFDGSESNLYLGCRKKSPQFIWLVWSEITLR